MRKAILLPLLLIMMSLGGASFEKFGNAPRKGLEYNLIRTEFNYEKDEDKFFLTEVISSPSLKNNKLGDPDKQSARIFLPPSYYSTGKRYPVVYYLHGFGSSYLEVDWYKDAYKRLMNSKDIKEFILVGVSGRNRFDGSFYVNSPVTGNWEDYVTKDVVNYIDSKFKTIAEPGSRGICGFSMGGFGAVNIGFRNSPVFSCIFAICPALLDNKDVQKVTKTWSPQIINGYGAAFAPNLNKPYPYMDVPRFDNSQEDNKIIEKWINGIGNLNEKVNENLENIKKLTGIRIEYGTRDYFDWIPDGCKQLSRCLTEKGIQNQLLEFDGGHGDKNRTIVEEHMFPYFAKLLKS